MDDTPFVSPLVRRRREGALAKLRFGAPRASPERAQLRARLDATLLETCASLPAPLRADAEADLRRYGAGQRSFIELFHPPTWSFLQAPELDDEARALAESVQAHGLFLHLWDDHLCDGQLAPTPARLQLGAAAWRRFEADALALAQHRDQTPGVVGEATARYFAALTGRAAVGELSAYLERFRDEVAIWTLAPRLVGGPRLAAVVEDFSVAWRLVDDLQDAREDILSGQRSALWWSCGEELRATWEACRRRRSGELRRGQVEPGAWARFEAAVFEQGIVAEALDSVHGLMCTSHCNAMILKYVHIAQEISEMAIGLTPPIPENGP